jgi:hypothetical protein
MDHGLGLSVLPVGGDTLKWRCRSCAAAQRLADAHTRNEGDSDDDVVVMSGPDRKFLIVLPRQHISGLEELSVPHRANVLAAVQRATRSVKNGNPWSTPRIHARTDVPASEGHLCIHVLAGDQDDTTDSTSRLA